MLKYLTFSFSIAIISWIAGMITNALLVKTGFYQKNLAVMDLHFVRNEKINTILGLQVFKWLIVHSFFKFFNPKLSMKKTILPSQLEDYRMEMTTAELNHLLAFAYMGIFTIFKAMQGLYLMAVVMLLVNILMNLYPSLLQQLNKRRIDRYLLLLRKRTAA